jgi:sn-glycerol 3-phosphate transport system substrate-binding protein
MKKYAEGFPQVLVARDQLEVAKAELSTYQNQRVTSIFNDALAAAITGKKDAATALKEAQTQADAILAEYR